eukprot:31551-Pelagococcus_subviridis.AAC.4
MTFSTSPRARSAAAVGHSPNARHTYPTTRSRLAGAAAANAGEHTALASIAINPGSRHVENAALAARCARIPASPCLSSEGRSIVLSLCWRFVFGRSRRGRGGGRTRTRRSGERDARRREGEVRVSPRERARQRLGQRARDQRVVHARVVVEPSSSSSSSPPTAPRQRDDDVRRLATALGLVIGDALRERARGGGRGEASEPVAAKRRRREGRIVVGCGGVGVGVVARGRRRERGAERPQRVEPRRPVFARCGRWTGREGRGATAGGG